MGSAAAATEVTGATPERDVAHDLVRRGLPAAPLFLVPSAAVWGLDGAVSAAYGLAIVLANFVFAAAVLTWAARISLGFLMGAALGGYLLRLGLVFAAVLLVKDAGWVELVPLSITIVASHLGLLVWETRYVSASLAFPGLRPADAKK